MQPSRKACSKWLSRQARDPYVKLRASGSISAVPLSLNDRGKTSDHSSVQTQDALGGFRSRSAYKLVQMNQKFQKFLEFPDVQTVVDLGAAPGGWSQVVSKIWASRPQDYHFGFRASDPDANEVSSPPKQPQVDKTDKQHRQRILQENIDPEDDGKSLKVPSRWLKRQPHPKENVASTSTKSLENFDPLNIGDSLTRLPSQRYNKRCIIALDLLAIGPIRYVERLQMDFLDPRTHQVIRDLLLSHHKINASAQVDVVLSDMSPSITGHIDTDITRSIELLSNVMSFARKTLVPAAVVGRKRAGVLIMKYFDHPLSQKFHDDEVRPYFEKVWTYKPLASRRESPEHYWVCVGYDPNGHFTSNRRCSTELLP